MILSVSNITKYYGATCVLNNISFFLNSGQCAGLIGSNGVGKSTLMQIIAGELDADVGEVTLAPNVEVGYLPQVLVGYSEETTINDLIDKSLGHLRQLESRMRYLEKKMKQVSDKEMPGVLDEYGSVAELFEKRGGYEIDHKVDMVFSGLQLNCISKNRTVTTLSGGEKARIGLATLLLQAPDLLLLDEPTNHLDLSMLNWLEDYLQTYSGVLLIVSHDRQFLNRTVQMILEIREYSHELKQYVGNYDAYQVNKDLERSRWVEEYRLQQEELKRLRLAIKTKARQIGHNRPARDADKITHKFFGERVQKAVSRNVRSLEERLRRIEENPIPQPPEDLRINSGFDPHVLEGKVPLIASGLSKSFDGRRLFSDINFAIEANSRIVLVGLNGAGKSTLLKALGGFESLDNGEVIKNPSVKIGYLDQEQETLDLDANVFEVYSRDLIGHEEGLLSDLLRYGFFKYEDVTKKVGELSVGQRRKLQIARLIAEQVNLLLLDEPTNHISFDVLEEFEKALLKFPGPIIAVSHDRWFIQRFAQEIWELHDGTLTQYSGDFDHYLSASALNVMIGERN